MEGVNDDSIYGPDKINVPVLAILARAPFWPADTEKFFGSMRRTSISIWEGVGHFLMMEKPKQFNEGVIVFLNKKSLLKLGVYTDMALEHGLESNFRLHAFNATS